ncbi:Alkaline nuclease [Frankliniella fusca]|uniref:Alkaline nuclease n=1 Tax=Frankliniella fusca TaxID=407009 RepID=A0AAE1HBZ9_9NEOP|nr:Alkaline nuclease [Frankliniella fusca]
MSKRKLFNGNYIKCLTGLDLVRYRDFMKLCGGIDPCETNLKDCVFDEKLMPQVNLIHIMDHLVNTTRSSTMDKMRNYNSSDAYRFLVVDGWVKSILLKKTPNNHILCLGRVKHSFQVDAPDNMQWALVKKNGEILSGLCTYTSCTSKACSWLPPHLKDVPYSRIKDVDYETPATKRKKLMRELEEEEAEDDPTSTVLPARSRHSVECSAESLAMFFEKLNVIHPSASVFRYCEGRAPQRVDIPSLNLLNKNNCDLSLSELRNKSADIFRSVYKITVPQQIKVEEITRGQSSSKAWFVVRKGRVGGSTVHTVMTTDINNPSITSVHAVCDPLRPQKKTHWMVQGSLNEPKARKEYVEFMKNRHFNFSIQECGAKIPVEYPFSIASTDGEIQCDCCGKGILEIKCPKDPNDDEDKVPSAHYDQIQHYLLCLGPDYKYADYMVWHEHGPTRKRVFPDHVRQQEILEENVNFTADKLPPQNFWEDTFFI